MTVEKLDLGDLRTGDADYIRKNLADGQKLFRVNLTQRGIRDVSYLVTAESANDAKECYSDGVPEDFEDEFDWDEEDVSGVEELTV